MVELHSGITHIMQNIEALEWLRPSKPEKAGKLICVYIGANYLVPSSTSSTVKDGVAPKWNRGL